MARQQVDGLHRRVEFGSWRDHEIVFNTETGCFECESVGFKDAKTLAEAKRLVDAQAKRKYTPVPAIKVSPYGKVEYATLLQPAGMHYDGKTPAVWWRMTKDAAGRKKDAITEFMADTPHNRTVLSEANKLDKQADELREKSRRLVKGMTRAALPEIDEDE